MTTKYRQFRAVQWLSIGTIGILLPFSENFSRNHGSRISNQSPPLEFFPKFPRRLRR
jgi:hypothetical protein